MANQRDLSVNQSLQHEIGFGRYQWELFILTGFGWLADSECSPRLKLASRC